MADDIFQFSNPFAGQISQTDDAIDALKPRISKLQEQAFAKDDYSLADGLATAFVGLLPGLIGYATDGYRGGAVGGAVGANAVGGFAKGLQEEGERDRALAGSQLKTAQQELTDLQKAKQQMQLRAGTAQASFDLARQKAADADEDRLADYSHDEKMAGIQHGYRVAEKSVRSADSLAADKGNVIPLPATRLEIIRNLEAASGKPLDPEIRASIESASGDQLDQLSKLVIQGRARDSADSVNDLGKAKFAWNVALEVRKREGMDPVLIQAGQDLANGIPSEHANDPAVRALAADLRAARGLESTIQDRNADNVRAETQAANTQSNADRNFELAQQREQRMSVAQQAKAAIQQQGATPEMAAVLEKMINEEPLTTEERVISMNKAVQGAYENALKQGNLKVSQSFADNNVKKTAQNAERMAAQKAQVAARVSPLADLVDPSRPLTEFDEKKSKPILAATEKMDGSLRRIEKLLKGGRDVLQGNLGPLDSEIAVLQGSIRELLNTGAKLEGKEGEMVTALAGVSYGNEGYLKTLLTDARKDPREQARYVRGLLMKNANAGLSAYNVRVNQATMSGQSPKPRESDYASFAEYEAAAKAWLAERGR